MAYQYAIKSSIKSALNYSKLSLRAKKCGDEYSEKEFRKFANAFFSLARGYKTASDAFIKNKQPNVANCHE